MDQNIGQVSNRLDENIEWEDIVRVTSPQSLQVELTDGDRYFGTLGEAEEA